MSVIAWDGKMLAADRMGSNAELSFTCTKLFVFDGVGYAICGDRASGEVLMEWHKAGADPEKWPAAHQADNERWARLVVVEDGKCSFYEREPVCIPVEDAYGAWGSGRDYAYGALYMGANAREAVLAASEWCATCGRGVDVFAVKENGLENL